ncbi:hypothetical protein HF086_008814 [Spodoptera exigua]|uniref:BESS domain-containing protein n=1 Tax=Spodoptera exigua TaxID=7107 RepID=A0A922SN54_SPOEX|nr:hypothetical protein HF086_008814 [Spodoptera exigua]
MLFLVPCMEFRPTEGSIENSESNQDDTNTSNSQSYPQRKRRTKQSDCDEQIIKALQANEDDDTNYCLSLVPFMKELTSDEKIDVRISILQTFKDIKKRRLLPNTSFNIIQPSNSQFSRASRRTTPSSSVRIISDQVIQLKQSHSAHSTHQANLSQHLTESHYQHSTTGPQDAIPSYVQLSRSPSPESQTPPPQPKIPSPEDHDSIITYWSNFSESESEIIDL